MRSRGFLTSLVTTAMLFTGLMFTTAPLASAATGCVDSDEWASTQGGMISDEVDAVFGATGDVHISETDRTSVIYEACNGHAQGEVFFRGSDGEQQGLYDQTWTQTGPADTPDCVSRSERRQVAGTHYRSDRVHRIFDIRGRYEYRYNFEGRRYVTRSYRVCGEQGDLLRFGVEYVYYRSTNAWHRNTSFVWYASGGD